VSPEAEYQDLRPLLQAINAWMDGHPEGAEVWARFRDNPQVEAGTLAQWVQEHANEAPASIAIQVSGGAIEKLTTIAQVNAGVLIILDSTQPSAPQAPSAALPSFDHAALDSVCKEILRRRVSMLGLTPDTILSTALTTVIDAFVDTERPCMAVTGRSGIGKTTGALRWALDHSDWATVFVDAASLLASGGADIDKAVLAALARVEPQVLSSHHTAESLARLGQQAGRPTLFVIDAPNEAGTLDHVAMGLIELCAAAAAGRFKVLILCRDTEWPLLASSIPRHFLWTPDTRDGNADDVAAHVLTDEELRRLLDVYAAHYRVKVRLAGPAWEQARVPIFVRFFFETHEGQGQVDATDLRDAVARYIDRKLQQAALRRGRTTYVERAARILDVISAQQFDRPQERLAKQSKVLDGGADEQDLDALVRVGLLVQYPDIGTGDILLDFCFESVAEWWQSRWLMRTLGISSLDALLPMLHSTAVQPPDVTRAVIRLCELLAPEAGSLREQLCHTALEFSPTLFARCVRRIAPLLYTGDAELAQLFCERLRAVYQTALQQYFSPIKRLLNPYNNEHDPRSSITVQASFSTGLQDVFYSFHTDQELHDNELTLGREFPQGIVMLDDLKLPTNMIRQTAGRVTRQLHRRIDDSDFSYKGLSIRTPEYTALHDALEEVSVAIDSAIWTETAELTWERIQMLAEKWHIPHEDLTFDRLMTTWQQYQPRVSREERQRRDWDHDIEFLMDDLERIRNIERRPSLPPVPIRPASEDDGAPLYTGDKVGAYFPALASWVMRGYQTICEGNFTELVRMSMPLYRTYPWSIIIISDGTHVRFFFVPGRQSSDITIRHQIFGPGRATSAKPLLVNGQDLEELLREVLTEHGMPWPDVRPFDVTLNIGQMLNSGIPLNLLMRTLVRRDLSAAFAGLVREKN
jgi:hypothetical protein